MTPIPDVPVRRFTLPLFTLMRADMCGPLRFANPADGLPILSLFTTAEKADRFAIAATTGRLPVVVLRTTEEVNEFAIEQINVLNGRRAKIIAINPELDADGIATFEGYPVEALALAFPEP